MAVNLLNMLSNILIIMLLHTYCMCAIRDYVGLPIKERRLQMKFSRMTKGEIFCVIHIIRLIEDMSYQACCMTINTAIGVIHTSKNPFTCYVVGMIGMRHELPHAMIHQAIEFHIHGNIPVMYL